MPEEQRRSSPVVPLHTVEPSEYPTEDGTETFPVTGHENCSICLGPCDQLTINNPCQHAFCLECISHWLWEHRTCPMCRGRVSTFRFIIESPSGSPVWRVQSFRRNPNNRPYVIQTRNELIIETFPDESVFLITPHYFRGEKFYRTLNIMDNAHVIMTLPPIGSFLVLGQFLQIAIRELETAGIKPFRGAPLRRNGGFRHWPQFIAHPRHS